MGGLNQMKTLLDRHEIQKTEEAAREYIKGAFKSKHDIRVPNSDEYMDRRREVPE